MIRRLLIPGILALLSGCGADPALVLAPASGLSGSGATVETILVATARQPEPDGPGFTHERSDTPTFARYDVSVPPDRPPGVIRTANPDRADPARDYIVTASAPISGPADFRSQINRQLAAGPDAVEDVSVFVHGFKVSFAAGLYRHAQLQADYGLHSVPVSFSWPATTSLRGYVHDRESALFSRDALTTTLREIAATRARTIDLMAHSMGAFLLMEALRDLDTAGDSRTLSRINAVMLLAPDIEIDVFRRQAAPLVARGIPIFVVTSRRDLALRASAFLRGERRRLGSVQSLDELGGLDINLIDASRLDGQGLLGHSAVFRSPTLSRMVRGMEQEGIDIFGDAGHGNPLAAGVALISDGADLLLSPLTD
jgi:esterase/lipase superfamily enzyme